MTKPTLIPLDQIRAELPAIVRDWIVAGLEEQRDLLRDHRETPDHSYELTAIERSISDVLIDGDKLVVKFFGGELFLYRITLTEL